METIVALIVFGVVVLAFLALWAYAFYLTNH
jgi:hypothetical protein